MSHRLSAQIGAAPLSLETGKIAKQAHGSVVVEQGGTVVLVAAVFDPTPSDNDFIALTVDYRERAYASGKIPGGFFKREGRPTEKETLSARLIDRPIRPLFPHGFQQEIQVIATVLSSDGEYDPDVLAIIGASAALQLSPLPYPKLPVGAVRIGLLNGNWLVNPTYQQLAQSPIDIVVAGTPEGILSIEGGFKEVPEQQVMEAIQLAYDHILKITKLQQDLCAKAGKPKITIELKQPAPEILTKVRSLAVAKLAQANRLTVKEEREAALRQMRASIVEQMAPSGGAVEPSAVELALEEVEHTEIRKHILETGRRIDGRAYTDIRTITCEVAVLPRTHGSGLFTRGQTQSLCVTTLGTSDDKQRVEALEGESSKRFMLHYNFPPYSVGEVRRISGPGRREIGHGALAERALSPVIPSEDEFPYAIRVVSEILESNGSSSMASVCAGTLALMDAGVTIKAPVAGVAMGLVKEGSKAAILTDISGLEDHAGDMDFKVAGTRLGVTAMQVDVKLSDGLSVELIGRIMSQTHPARMIVLDKIAAVIEKPRPDISTYAPRITTIKISTDKIRDVIGPGGRVIRKIIEETGVSIDVEDDGRVSIASTSAEAAEKALAIIRGLTEDVEVGRIYNAKVKRIMNFGAFCEILPGKEGLVHISELADKYVGKVDDVVKLGDEFKVKVIEIDEQGRVNLSKKRAEPKSEAKPDAKPEAAKPETKPS